MPYDDGARTIFLYTRGKLGNIPRQLGELLEYMEHTGEENVVNDELREIHRMVDAVKKDEEVSKDYMKVYEKEQMLLRQGREEGKGEERESLLFELLREGEISEKVAAAKLNITQEQLREKIENQVYGQ